MSNSIMRTRTTSVMLETLQMRWKFKTRLEMTLRSHLKMRYLKLAVKPRVLEISVKREKFH